MTGVTGLLENFFYYYERILIQSTNTGLAPHQRNRLYERYRMAEAFYICVLKDPELTLPERQELEKRFRRLTDIVRNVQRCSGDTELQAM